MCGDCGAVALGEGSNEFPILAALAARGAAPTTGARLDWASASGVASATRGACSPSFATCEPGGFVERDFTLIDATLPAFALAFKASIAIRHRAYALVTTYLGRDAAAHPTRRDRMPR